MFLGNHFPWEKNTIKILELEVESIIEINCSDFCKWNDWEKILFLIFANEVTEKKYLLEDHTVC